MLGPCQMWHCTWQTVQKSHNLSGLTTVQGAFGPHDWILGYWVFRKNCLGILILSRRWPVDVGYQPVGCPRILDMDFVLLRRKSKLGVAPSRSTASSRSFQAAWFPWIVFSIAQSIHKNLAAEISAVTQRKSLKKRILVILKNLHHQDSFFEVNFASFWRNWGKDNSFT